MHWPQITMVIFMLIELGFVLGKDGQPRDNYNFGRTIFSTAIMGSLLYAGGFFS